MRSEICARCRPLVALARRQILRSTVQQQQQRRNESTTNDAVAQIRGWAEEQAEEQTEKEKRRNVVFSGIQPTGIPHLGNYLGALRQWKRLQDQAEGTDDRLLFSVVDLHAITMPQEASQLRTRRREMLASLMAVGLDPEKGSTIFFQSSVPQHTELMWILSCTASMGYLSRMTQWKSKLNIHNKQAAFDEKAAQQLKLGLFSYPVLQAADILVHRATHVPVGADQTQHLEFARECATNFNATFSDILVPPETVIAPAPRIMSLQSPNNKMSKSAANHRSRILLNAPAAEIARRIRGAVTDSQNFVTWEPTTRPGVANLLEILSQCGELAGAGAGTTTPRQLAEERYAGASLKALKDDVAAAVCAELAGVRERYDDFLARKGGRWLDEIEAEGAEAARRSAEKTMRLVRHAVGIGPRPNAYNTL